jgi:hypothetical protein
MIEILKDTEQRLVLTLGPGARRRARFVLDKEAGQAWLERRGLLPSRTVRMALSEIASINAAGDRLVIVQKSGVRHIFAGDADSVREAAARLTAFSGVTDTLGTPVPHPSTPWLRRAVQISIAVAVLALLAVAGFKIPDFFILPACDAQRTRDTLHDLLQGKAAGPITLSDFSTISHDKREYRCAAEIAVNGDHARAGYRSYWNGWSAMVRVTGALGMARLDPTRMHEIDEAYDAFMTRATDAYQSGEPPRQSEPIINTELTTMFDVLALTQKTLAGADIDEAIRWFNSGDTVGAVYLLAGTGVNDIAQLPQDDATQKKLRENVVRFADEFGRYLDFQVTLLGAVADAQASYASGGPPDEIDSADYNRKMSDIKALLAQALKTDFISLVYDGLTSDWRLKRLDAIARVAPVAAKVLPREELAAIRDQANLTLPYFSSDDAVRLRVSEVTGMLGR